MVVSAVVADVFHPFMEQAEDGQAGEYGGLQVRNLHSMKWGRQRRCNKET